jgi:hypothetical protein
MPTHKELIESLSAREAKPAEGAPHGWLSWKDTEACLTVRCACGTVSHLDGMFAYFVACPVCGAVYWANAHVQLVPLTAQEAATLDREGNGAMVGEL